MLWDIDREIKKSRWESRLFLPLLLLLSFQNFNVIVKISGIQICIPSLPFQGGVGVVCRGLLEIWFLSISSFAAFFRKKPAPKNLASRRKPQTKHFTTRRLDFNSILQFLIDFFKVSNISGEIFSYRNHLPAGIRLPETVFFPFGFVAGVFNARGDTEYRYKCEMQDASLI